MRPWCVKCSGVVKMAKKMKINGRKLKDRGGDDLAVIFLARLQRVSQCTRKKNSRGYDAPSPSSPVHYHRHFRWFTVIIKFTRPGGWLIPCGRRAIREVTCSFITPEAKTNGIMSINSLIHPFITFFLHHTFGKIIYVYCTYVGVSYLQFKCN